MAERARAEFARAVHPADNPSSGEIVGDALDQRRLVELLHVLAVLTRHAGELGGIDGRTPERMIRQLAIRIAEVDRGPRRAPHPARSPASPGAGGTNTRSKPDSARMRAFATPLSATPPPKQRSGSPVSRRSRVAMSTRMSSSTRCTLAAQSAKRRPSDDSEIDRIVRDGVPARRDRRISTNTTARPSSETRSIRARARTRRRATAGSPYAPARSSSAARTRPAPSPCIRLR